jgi:hypothetical protein
MQEVLNHGEALFFFCLLLSSIFNSVEACTDDITSTVAVCCFRIYYLHLLNCKDPFVWPRDQLHCILSQLSHTTILRDTPRVSFFIAQQHRHRHDVIE